MGVLPSDYFQLDPVAQEQARNAAREGDPASAGYFNPTGPGGVWVRSTSYVAPIHRTSGTATGNESPVTITDQSGEFAGITAFVNQHPVVTLGAVLIGILLMRGKF